MGLFKGGPIIVRVLSMEWYMRQDSDWFIYEGVHISLIFFDVLWYPALIEAMFNILILFLIYLNSD